MGAGMSADEINALPAAVDLATAARALGISKSKAYELVLTDDLPVPALRVGRLWRVKTADLRRVLGLDRDDTGRSVNVALIEARIARDAAAAAVDATRTVLAKHQARLDAVLADQQDGSLTSNTA